MDSDEVSQIHEQMKHAWLQRLHQYGTNGVEILASKYRNGNKCACMSMDHGSFNYCFKVLFDDGTAWAVRFPIAGDVMHPEEKVRHEVAIMKFLKENTRILVPTVIAFGMATDNHDPEIGPFIIAEWIEGVLLSSVMEELPRSPRGPVLRKDISDDTLYIIYRQMAKILLELSMHDFDKIGALSFVNDESGTTSWHVTYAPLTLKINEIERSGYVRLRGKTSIFGYTLRLIVQIVSQSLFKVLRRMYKILFSRASDIYVSKEILWTMLMTLVRNTSTANEFNAQRHILSPRNTTLVLTK